MNVRTLVLLLLLLLLAGCLAPAATEIPVGPPPSSPAPTLPAPTATAVPDPTAVPTPARIPYQAPDWFENAVLYEIYVRSFADSDGDGIGDFNGIAARLDYLESLQVDVVWLMPIHPSPSVHGYDVTDYFAVNPEYGTLEDFQALVAGLHARDIRVVIDFVASHASNQHPFFQDAYGNPDSLYSDWFRFTNDAQTTYEGFDNLSTLPRFNHFNPGAVRHLTEAALFWLDLDGDGDTTDGVDGFRIDNATYPPKVFFVDLRQQIKRANPDALILGEVWVEQVAVLSPYFEDQFDALFNFPLYTLIEDSSGQDEAGGFLWNLPPSLYGRRLEDQAADYLPEGILVQFASNHDTDRIASTVAGSLEWEKFMAAATIVLPESYALYYGEEIGMFGVKGGPPHWDSYRREPMDWYASGQGPLQTTWFLEPDRWNRPGDGVSVEEQDADPDSLLNFYRHLLGLRAEIPALRSDEFAILDVQAVGRKAWAIARFSGSQVFIGIYNFGTEAVEVILPAFPFSSDALIDQIAGVEFPGSTGGEPYTLPLPPAGAVWFVGSSD